MRRVTSLRSSLAALIFTLSVTLAQAEPLKIRVGFSDALSTLTPLLFVNKSVLKHYGQSYTVETVFLAGGGPTLTALAAGELDVAQMNFQALPLAIKRANLDLKVIADTNQSGVPGFTDANFVAKKGQFKSIPDIKGAVIGINAINSSSDAAGREFLGKHGLVANKDYTLVELRFTAMIPALKSGRIQIATLIPPFNHELLDTGEYEVLFSQGSSFGITQGSMWAAKADWLQKNRAAVMDFAEDFLRARRWIVDPKNRDQALKMVSDETKVPVSGLSHWMFTGRDYYRDPDGLPNLEAIQRNIDQANQAGILPVTIKITDHVDLSFMQEAKRRIEKP